MAGRLGEPRYAAAGRGGRDAYVTDAAHGELVVIDLPATRIVDRVQVGALARHLTIAPDLGTVTTLGSTGAFIRRERVTRAAHDACIARSLR